MNMDLSDVFYRINLNIYYIPKLGIVSLVQPGESPIVTLPLVLPIFSKNTNFLITREIVEVKSPTQRLH